MAQCDVKVLSYGERIGLLCTVVASCVSLVAVLSVFTRLVNHALRNRRLKPGQGGQIITTHLDVYLVWLLLSDILQAFGGIASIRWIYDGVVSCGPLCDAQGIFKMLGDPGTSMFTIAITVHTFSVIVLGWTPPHNFKIPTVVVVVAWAYRLVLFGAAKGTEAPEASLFGPTPYWCWISEQHKYARIPGSFMWYWLSTATAVALYIPVFLRIRGNLDVNRQHPWRVSVHRAELPRRIDGRFNPVSQSRKMLLYPIVYTVLIVPFSVLRWIVNFTRVKQVEAPLYFVFISIFYLAGLANVLLLVFTRPNVLGFSNERQQQPDQEAPPVRVQFRRGSELETVASEGAPET